MLPDRVSSQVPYRLRYAARLCYSRKRKYVAGHGIEPGPLALESDALPIVSRGPAQQIGTAF